MAEIHENCKKWISLIQNLELDEAAESLKDSKNFINDESTNKYLFKVLLHLSHTADKCYREKLSKETQVFTIANSICKNLKSVSDKNNLFKAVYYVIYYLLKNQRFKEAKIITSYLLPGKILAEDDQYESSKYHQIAVLWQSELLKRLDSLVAKFKKENKSLVEEEMFAHSLFHLEIVNFSDSFGILKAVDMYVQRLSTIPLKIIFPYFLKLFKYLAECFKSLKSNWIIFYNSFILIVANAFFKRSDAINHPDILNYFRQCDKYFLDSFTVSTLCYECYEFFRNYSLNLFETNFMTKEIGQRYKRSFENLKTLIQKYGNENTPVQETAAAVALSFETYFSSLENLVIKQLKGTKLSHGDILKLGDFVKEIYSILKFRPFTKNYVCRKCSESQKCLIKNDIYHASTVITSYMKVISKYSNESVEENFFSTAKVLMKELINAYNEVDKFGCKYSFPLWDSCGRIIFNIGLISETKFPKELEEFYEVLCKQIVRHDGLDSKLSSFGLENPVGTSLHRLCNANFNQEKFRKAMSYAAYNALLSNIENRKKKACDMWANIKFKLIDSKKIQELTLLKCLEVDTEIVKKLGISVNLDKYNASDLCLRELNSLYQVKGNMILSMKSVLNELDSKNEDLNYAKGVLLLCFHSIQLSKREFILGFITKALEKLKTFKPKTLTTHTLIANLNFFNIIEKLYARSVAVSQQIEEANFTIKAFRTLKGKQLFDETENEKENDNEVVPTYGGINIDEDNRLAKELKNVINMWEACIEKNQAEISSIWEPQYTLETIVICGEYCRLYKFDYVERNCWKIAYTLAAKLKDYATCIYVTSRSLSLKFINETWINESENHVEKLKNSNKSMETDVVILYWLSLADFYLDCNKITDAKLLLEKVKAMSNHKILSNTKLYVYSADINLRNYFLMNTDTSQEDYIKLLVEIHYSMISLHDLVTQDTCRFWQFRFHLFSCEQIFNVMCNMILPMSSLLSYREVSAHLVYGMSVAQKLGMTLRISDFLKYLCYIDLLRGKVEDCEIKLQDLEHILCLENFQMSMKTKLTDKTNTRTVPVNEIRDASAIIPINMSKNKASPELKKKMFLAPSFLSHTTFCNCFFCSNISYQYLTFSCSHIRAQLYSLLNYVSEARLHFQGASNIMLRLNEIDSDKVRQTKNYQWKRIQNFTVDSLLCSLDYTVFLIDFYPEKQEEALTVIEYIMDSATKNGLSKHYVYNYANELYLQHFMYNMFQDKMSSISVPDEIPVTITNQPVDGCITPKQPSEKIYQNLRRKTPPAVAIPKIAITDSSSEEDNSIEIIEPLINVKKTKKPSTRNVRRKILIDECDENGDLSENIERRSTRSMRKKTLVESS